MTRGQKNTAGDAGKGNLVINMDFQLISGMGQGWVLGARHGHFAWMLQNLNQQGRGHGQQSCREQGPGGLGHLARPGVSRVIWINAGWGTSRNVIRPAIEFIGQI